MTRILYVEDEVLLALSAEVTLQDADYEVMLAFDGREALKLAQASAPDLVITDYMMPAMDGAQLASALRQAGLAVPVLLTTAIPERDLGADIRALFDGYLGKPVEPDMLVEAVRRLFHSGGQGSG